MVIPADIPGTTWSNAAGRALTSRRRVPMTESCCCKMSVLILSVLGLYEPPLLGYKLFEDWAPPLKLKDGSCDLKSRYGNSD